MAKVDPAQLLITDTLSVVVPFLGERAALISCLSALAKCDQAPSEIIVVENGEFPQHTEVAAQFQNVKILHEHEPGPGPSRNTGANEAKFSIIAFLDQDCEPSAGWVTEILHTFSDPSVNIAGGRVDVGCDHSERLKGIDAFQKVFSYRNDWFIERYGFTGTGNLAVRKSVFFRIGPFSGIESNEEHDWGQRSARAGYRIKYVESMLVHHPASISLLGLMHRVERECVHAKREHLERSRSLATWLFWTFMVIPSLVFSLMEVVRTDRVAGFWNRMQSAYFHTLLEFWRVFISLKLIFNMQVEATTQAWRERTYSKAAPFKRLSKDGLPVAKRQKQSTREDD